MSLIVKDKLHMSVSIIFVMRMLVFNPLTMTEGSDTFSGVC
jgi:hypothetical protein